MAIKAGMTEKVVDKATNLFKKGFATFDKMVFLEEEQQDTLNTAATNYEIMQKIFNTNINEIEESISKMGDAKEIKEVREAIEKMRSQSMQETARRIAAGENVSIKQTLQFSKDLMEIKKGFGKLDTNVGISFDGLIKTQMKQMLSNANSAEVQDVHFRSLLIGIKEQSDYLNKQVAHMEKQDNLDEKQIALLETHKKDLAIINKYSEKMANFSKMGPEELKKNREELNIISGEISNEIFESKMYTSFNQIDNSIQSLSVDSERLNETMGDLTEAQVSGKEVIAGTAMRLKKGAKGMVSSMVLAAMGLGGLDEALGVSEKFSQLDLFGRQGLFGKGGLLSNIMKLKGISGVVGGGLAVAGAGAAGYAFGSWLKKKIDEVGGEEDFLGASFYRFIYHKEEKRMEETAEFVKQQQKWNKMSRENAEAIDAGLEEMEVMIEELKVTEFGIKEPIEALLSEEKQKRIAEIREMKAILERKKERFLKGKKGEVIPVEEETEIISVEGGIERGISPKTMASTIEPIIEEKRITPEEVSYLPKTMEDTTNLIIENAKKDREQIVKAQEQPSVLIPPPTVPAPVDLSKSIDDPTLTILNNDIFG